MDEHTIASAGNGRAAAKDFSITFLKQLGFHGVTDTIANMPGGLNERRVLVSPERYADLEADLIMGTSSLGPKQLDKLAKHPIFARLPAVSRARTSRSTSGAPLPWSSPRR